MESKAIAKYVRVAPRKTQLVARNVKGLPVEQALNILRFTPNKPAGVILAVVRSALANAEHNSNLDVDNLYVKDVLVNEGPAWKRFMPRAQGRATHIRKRTSHVTVILAEGQE
ncbi:MAG: 50S ribosomal protein L22 [Desulfovibrionaceae bacterium]|nr:50S ribosomal protein L22 [Desulfovibrionaceae bacterium]MBR5734831.1 50S ribosomal protein L22 [Desulfovibrionaceae bacterium]